MTTPPPRTTEALQEAALRFLRRFGVVAAAWATLLALTVPGGVERPIVLWSGLAVVWTWALASQVVGTPRQWWTGWFVVAIGLELLGPLARTGGSSLAGGVSFLVLAGVALAGHRAWVAATVGVLSAVALLRPLVNPTWTVGGSVSTVLLFVFGGIALTWLVEVVAGAQAERDRLTTALHEAEREAAVARERSEAARRNRFSSWVVPTRTAARSGCRSSGTTCWTSVVRRWSTPRPRRCATRSPTAGRPSGCCSSAPTTSSCAGSRTGATASTRRRWTTTAWASGARSWVDWRRSVAAHACRPSTAASGGCRSPDPERRLVASGSVTRSLLSMLLAAAISSSAALGFGVRIAAEADDTHVPTVVAPTPAALPLGEATPGLTPRTVRVARGIAAPAVAPPPPAPAPAGATGVGTLLAASTTCGGWRRPRP